MAHQRSNVQTFKRSNAPAQPSRRYRGLIPDLRDGEAVVLLQRRHAAVLRTEATGGETSVLFTTDPHLTRQALSLAARRLGLQDLAVARHVLYLPELPVLGSGKTDYVTLQSVDPLLGAANDGLLQAAEPARPYSVGPAR